MSERTREYDKPIGSFGDVVRVRFTTDHGQLIRYMIQYEVSHEQQYRPAMRYDNAHGFPHRDTLDWAGETVSKDPVSADTAAEALTMALDEVEAYWPLFRDELLRRKP